MIKITENKERNEVVPCSFIYDLHNICEEHTLDIEIYEDDADYEKGITQTDKRHVKMEFDVFYPYDGCLDELYEMSDVNKRFVVVELDRYKSMLKAESYMNRKTSKKYSWWNKFLNWLGHGE